MFRVLYEVIGKNPDPAYVSDVYPSLGLFTLLLSVIFALIFYLLLGRWKPIWDKTSHWLITLFVLALLSACFAISSSKSATKGEADSFMYSLALINAVYSAIYFTIFSLLLKKGSIFAKRTPF